MQSAPVLSTIKGKTPGDRLRELRLQRGIKTATLAAQQIGVNRVTYQHHENGTRAVSRAAAARYSAFYGVPAGTILYGERLQFAQRVPIVGRITGRGDISMPKKGDGAVDAPPGTDTDLRAMRVETDELWPAYRRGETVFYREPQGITALEKLNGRDCIVIIDGGKRLLRTIIPTGGGLVTLTAYAAPPMRNVRLIAASPVLWVARSPL